MHGEVGKRKVEGESTLLSDQPQTYSLWPGPSNGSNNHVGNAGNLCESTALASYLNEAIPGGARTPCNSQWC
jgi:hypothetical protein